MAKKISLAKGLSEVIEPEIVPKKVEIPKVGVIIAEVISITSKKESNDHVLFSVKDSHKLALGKEYEIKI